jgi:hypothetical protein
MPSRRRTFLASASAVGVAWRTDLAFVGVAGAVHALDGSAG